MNHIEVMKQALEALDRMQSHYGDYSDWKPGDYEMTDELMSIVDLNCARETITALRVAIASYSTAIEAAEKQSAERGESEPPEWMRPNKWTLLLTGDNNGLVGKFGHKFEGHPEYYERIDVYTHSAPAAPVQEENLYDLAVKADNGGQP